MTCTSWTHIGFYFFIFCWREEITHHETAAWKLSETSLLSQEACGKGFKRTFRWGVRDIFGAFFTAATGRCVLQVRWALQNWACFLHARELLAGALALYARVFCQRHFALFKDVLTIQMAAWNEKREKINNRRQNDKLMDDWLVAEGLELVSPKNKTSLISSKESRE